MGAGAAVFKLLLIVSLSQALPIETGSDSQLPMKEKNNLNSELQMEEKIMEDNLELLRKALKALEFAAWMSQSLPDMVGTESPTVLNKIVGISNPRPMSNFHPAIVRDEMKEVKDNWDDWDGPWDPWAWLKRPSTNRPFNPFDYRIIG